MTEDELKVFNDKREWILKVNAVFYEKSAAYTNLIMVAGYAAYFALWSNTSALISQCLARISATLMLISVFTFVFWEVTKMIVISLNNKNMAKIALAPNENFESMLQAFLINEQTIMARLTTAWPIILFIAIPTALVAIGIHVWALISANLIN